MGRRTRVHVRAGILACLLGLSACAGWGVREPLNVTIADITPLDMTVLEQRYAVKVQVLNPNDAEITFDGVAFDLEINGKPFARGVSSRGGVVPRFGEAVIEMQVVSGLQNILRQIAQLQKGDRAGFTYRVKGRLHSTGGLGSIPFHTKGEFAFPTGGGKSGT
jgi:LEA14-like dessication related protein